MFLFGPDIRQKLRGRILLSAKAKDVAEAILGRSCAMLADAPISRQFEPMRPVLLPTTRRFADRTQHLILAWLLTGEVRFIRCAVDDLMVVTGFTDWNPTHFLDVAEMVAAVAMVGKWTAPFLTAGQAAQVEDAILRLGLMPGLAAFRGRSGWTERAGNWNIVCSSALIVAAVAVSGTQPQISAEVMAQAQAALRVGMQAVGPFGEWFEGLTYWSYAAHYAALAQIVVEQAGYALQNPQLFDPILRGGCFAAASIGPSGLAANFGDNLSVPERCPMQAWISARYGRQLPAELAGRHPFELVWGTDSLIEADPPRSFAGNHLVALRCGRKDWLAVSIGTAEHSHAHHDLGSFLWECDAVRFVVDPGRLDYARKGYFKAERFDHLAASAAGHNLPVFDPASMRGWQAQIGQCSETGHAAEVVIRSAAPDHGPEVIRHFTVSEGGLLIEDRIFKGSAGRETKPLRWQFHTDAQVELDGKNLYLRKSGYKVRVSADLPDLGQWTLTPLDAAILGLADGGTVNCVSFDLDETSGDHRVVVRFERITVD